MMSNAAQILNTELSPEDIIRDGMKSLTEDQDNSPSEELDLNSFGKVGMMVNGEPLPEEEPPVGNDQIIEEEVDERRHQPQKKRNKRTENQRIEHLTWEKHQIRMQAEQEANRARQLEERNRQLEEELSRKAKEAQEKEELARIYYEHTLKVNKASANEGLKKALEEGNVEEFTRLNDVISKSNADLAAYELKKNEPKQEYVPQYNQQQNYEPPRHPQENINPAFEEFVYKNDYMNPNSPNYSPKLEEEAYTIMEQFNESLKFKKLGHTIGTPEYFDAIDYAMRVRYDPSSVQEHSQEEDYQEPRTRRNNVVTPVNRSGYSRGNSNTQRGKYNPEYLTESQKKIAYTAGTIIKKRNGQPYSPYELEKLYAHYANNPLPSVNNE